MLIPHLGGGGAERVTALLAQGLSGRKYELHLALIAQAHAGPESLPPSVVMHALGAPRVRAGALRLLRLVWQLKPDVILSGMAHLNFLVLLLRPFFPHRTRVLVRQNGTVSALLASASRPVTTRILYRLLYRYADRVICQTPAMATDLARQLGISGPRLAVLPNPVDVNAIRKAIVEDPILWTGPGPHLLAIGRLSPEKGFDLLLRALASVRERFTGADLLIAGAGREEPVLKALCRNLGLETSVRFAGNVDRPAAYFPGASAFVLSSRHEALPNAMLEAAAAGLPIIALPASQGIVDLLCSQAGTWIAPEISSAALASSLIAALELLRPAERFLHTFIEDFKIDRAIQAYEELIDAVLRERRR